MMILDLGLFFFVLLGSKIVLGAVAIYLLLSRDATCEICDAEMLPLEHPRGAGRILDLVRLQRRWCMECRRETLTRRVPLRSAERRAAVPVAERRIR